MFKKKENGFIFFSDYDLMLEKGEELIFTGEDTVCNTELKEFLESLQYRDREFKDYKFSVMAHYKLVVWDDNSDDTYIYVIYKLLDIDKEHLEEDIYCSGVIAEHYDSIIALVGNLGNINAINLGIYSPEYKTVVETNDYIVTIKEFGNARDLYIMKRDKEAKMVENYKDWFIEKDSKTMFYRTQNKNKRSDIMLDNHTDKIITDYIKKNYEFLFCNNESVDFTINTYCKNDLDYLLPKLYYSEDDDISIEFETLKNSVSIGGNEKLPDFNMKEQFILVKKVAESYKHFNDWCTDYKTEIIIYFPSSNFDEEKNPYQEENN